LPDLSAVDQFRLRHAAVRDHLIEQADANTDVLGCKFAIAPPSVPVNDWTLWQTRDLDFAETDENRQKAIRTDIANILAAFQKREDG
jgi:hypothetical protein